MMEHERNLEELRQAVLQKKIQERVRLASHEAVQQPIPKAPRDRDLPLSPAQQQLWLLDQLDRQASLAYHIPAGLRLEGPLDPAALKEALSRIVARHEALRTRFVQTEDGPVQRFAAPDCGFALAEQDLSQFDAGTRDAALRAIVAEEATAPFDLAEGPPVRGRLLRLGVDEHVLLVTQHHIVSDGWSIGILVREFALSYEALRQGADDPLPPLAIQYGDYALWQREQVHAESVQGQIDYWVQHLRGAPALLDLPTDRPRPAVQSYAGAGVEFVLDATLAARLGSLAQRHGATLYMVLMAGWSALLARLSGQDEVVVGVPVANRRRAELEPLIGFFVNTLAVRIRFAPDQSVAALLAQVKDALLGAYAHQDVPFEQVTEALRPPRRPSHHPVFQTILGLNNTPAAEPLRLADLVVSELEVPKSAAQFELALAATQRDGKILLSLSYAQALFEAATIEAMRDQLCLLLEGMTESELRPVLELPMVGTQAQQLLLHRFNASSETSSHAPPVLVHRLFEQVARANPEAVALRDGELRISYDALNRQANQLAVQLRELGARRGVRVGICLRRSADMVLAVLGSLKAGATYIPFDPTTPPDRMSWMLGDCRPLVMLTEEALLDELPALGALQFYCLDDVQARQRRAFLPDSDPVGAAGEPGASDLAYIIYTSGSTGNPKGVMVPHRGLNNYLWWAASYYGAGTPVHSLLSSPLAFDATITSLFLPLVSGGSVTLTPDGRELDMIEPLLRTSGCSLLVKITPAHLAALGQSLAAQGLNCPGHLFVIGGEALAAATVRLWRGVSPASRLINEYGPTETVVGCSVFDTAALPEGASSVPIGRPIDNARIYVLDKVGSLAPIGAIGEIFIGGDGVAAGYLNRPELSAERFVDLALADLPPQRLYRTGDIGRWRADGVLEYLGRNDFQVKLRGFRIELGEVEAVLARHPAVRNAIVLMHGGSSGEGHLVGFVKLTLGHELDYEQLRAYAGRQLPEYMLPSVLVSVDEWPLTVNGKVDRQALAGLVGTARGSAAFQAPEGELENLLARLWQELLGIDHVSRHDNFFELGGHSLIGIALLGRLRSQGWNSELRLLFGAPTLAGMAAVLEAARNNDTGADESGYPTETEIEEFRL